MPKILLVDDDESFRKMVRITLAQLGYQVREARNGREALGFFEEEPPDLILTDIVMPEKEGLEMIGELRLQHPWLRIVAMSGGGRVNAKDSLKVARRLGVDGVLEKPFSQEELEILLAKVLRPAS